MASETRGAKFICFTCQCKFYDLGRPEPICPRCGANQKSQPKPPKASGGRTRAAERVREEVYEPEAADVEPSSGDDDVEAELGDAGSDAADDDDED